MLSVVVMKDILFSSIFTFYYIFEENAYRILYVKPVPTIIDLGIFSLPLTLFSLSVIN